MKTSDPTDTTRLQRLASATLATFAAAAIAAAGLAWGVRLAVSDTVPSLQKLAWIPVPLLLVVVALGVGLGVGAAIVARRRARGGVATIVRNAGIVLMVAMVGEHLATRWGVAFGCEDPIRILHWNATSPSVEQSASQRADLAGREWDVLIVSNDATLFGRWFAHRWKEGPGGEEWPIRRAGPFALATGHRVLESRLAIASGGIWLGVFRVELPIGSRPGESGRELVIHVLDLPSDPGLPRWTLLAEVRRRIEDLQLPEPDLVMGDFNLDAGSGSLAAAYPDLLPAFDLAGEGYAASFPRRWPLWQTDQALVSDRLPVCRYRLLDLGFGTHRAQELSLERGRGDQRSDAGSRRPQIQS